MQNFLDYFNQSLLFRNFMEVLSGLDNTLLLLVISLPIGFVLSLVFALGRVSKNKILSKPIAGYIFVIRGTPLLVQIYLIYFGLGSIEFIRESFLWILLKEPCTAFESVFIAKVLAKPGTPSSKIWPLPNSPISKRSIISF